MSERQWELLLWAIKNGMCTPFLGGEGCVGSLPKRSEIAQDWAAKYEYPFDDDQNLPRVAQYIATEMLPVFVKRELVSKLQNVAPPDFSDPDEPHRVLADIPFSVYVTTSYDDFLTQALTSRVNPKAARRELCYWDPVIKKTKSAFDDADFCPDPANPVVFHLFGHTGNAESLVLTEDDYLDFLISISRRPSPVPAQVEASFTHALLFLGYQIDDLDFRVLVRSLASYLKIGNPKASVSVQLVQSSSDDSDEQRAKLERMRQYLLRYCKNLEIGVYLGTCSQFVKELRRRWENYPHA